MKFNDVYNVHCELTLDTGRGITLDTFLQRRTYAGLQVGTPNKDSNDQAFEWHLDFARGLPDCVGEPHLIPPPRRDYHVTPGDMQSVLDRQSDRPPNMLHIPEWVPDVYSVGVFHSLSPARNDAKDFSTLTILWYQPDFGVDTEAMQQIRVVDWKALATDQEW